jgi:hypothetical protein
MKFFALDATKSFGERVADNMGVSLSPHEEREFEDGEHKGRPLVCVRGSDAYVIQSLHGGPEQSVNDKLVRLLFFIGALREGGAQRVTAVIPYLAYARKDRQTKTRDPVTTRYLAEILEAAGADAGICARHSVMKTSSWRHLIPAASSARSYSAKRWSERLRVRSAQPSWRSAAAPAWSAATCSLARWQAQRQLSLTI